MAFVFPDSLLINLTPVLVIFGLCFVIGMSFKQEKLVVMWYLFSGVIHLLLEGMYGYNNTLVRTRNTITFTEFALQNVSSVSEYFKTTFWSNIYNQYARYDGRYAISDPMVVFFCWTELVEGILCFFLVYLIATKSAWRHPLQIINATAQAYGTVFYFLTPVIYNTWDTVMTSDQFELWVYVIILNGVWIFVPMLLIIQSARYMLQLIRRDLQTDVTKKRK